MIVDDVVPNATRKQTNNDKKSRSIPLALTRVRQSKPFHAVNHHPFDALGVRSVRRRSASCLHFANNSATKP